MDIHVEESISPEDQAQRATKGQQEHSQRQQHLARGSGSGSGSIPGPTQSGIQQQDQDQSQEQCCHWMTRSPAPGRRRQQVVMIEKTEDLTGLTGARQDVRDDHGHPGATNPPGVTGCMPWRLPPWPRGCQNDHLYSRSLEPRGGQGQYLTLGLGLDQDLVTEVEMDSNVNQLLSWKWKVILSYVQTWVLRDWWHQGKTSTGDPPRLTCAMYL